MMDSDYSPAKLYLQEQMADLTCGHWNTCVCYTVLDAGDILVNNTDKKCPVPSTMLSTGRTQTNKAKSEASKRRFAFAR